ncbi:MAG: 50S ribosomal protein L18 [Nanoarchaeota archaeon]|nr:50S ribosomal protein L18 [Nanoarchaeota archaeon]MBU1321369.1 50S ribosomal protein L18 [Nanoarchaeota archaeon]MBU1597361.1 50S ribosomal protein L18 [Nanoarchaeota archaeon]MBU2441276.1 50S ribosomal protein L18 [Nanoarchaeota archaeon]
MTGKKTIPFRRKRTGRTNYKKRLSLLKSKQIRLIIRKTNKQIILQMAEYSDNGDKIICGVSSTSLKKMGWKYSCINLPACYLAGLSLGKSALAKKIKEAILDVGLQTPIKGSRIYAALKGVVDAGIQIPVSEDIFPSEKRLSGEHISAFLTSNKNQTHFSEYNKIKVTPADFKKDFESMKKKING